MTAQAPSLFQIRLRAPHTASDAQWAETFRALAGNRGACRDDNGKHRTGCFFRTGRAQ